MSPAQERADTAVGMSGEDRPGPAKRPAWAYVAAYAAFAATTFGVGVAYNRPVPWEIPYRALSSALTWTSVYAALFWIGIRAGRRGGDLWRAGAWGALAATVIFNLQAVAHCAVLQRGPCTPGAFLLGLFYTLPLTLLQSFSVVLLGLGIVALDQWQRDRARALQAEAGLDRARLAALDVQLRPHFLFNTLQSVATLVHRDPAAARQMLAGLGSLLRESTRGEVQKIPLRDELALLRRYTDIEAIRFGDRLQIDECIRPDVLDAAVPTFLLQPVVENAIRYAVASRGDGRIEIEARRSDAAMLELSVSDNGPGLPPNWREPAGRVGLAATRARIQALYGPGSSLRIDNQPGRGARVTIVIPLEEGEPPVG